MAGSQADCKDWGPKTPYPWQTGPAYVRGCMPRTADSSAAICCNPGGWRHDEPRPDGETWTIAALSIFSYLANPGI